MSEHRAANLRFAPREVFVQILDYAVIPTFDLVLWVEGRGVLMARRKIAPYQGVWALPGLRIMKPEGIEDALVRIARLETGLEIDPDNRRFVGQYVGRFKTEHQRQDLSTCYAVPRVGGEVVINRDHFTGVRFIKTVTDIPAKTGAMYKYYLRLYFGATL